MSEKYEGKVPYSPTPKGNNLSDFQTGRGDVEEMRDKLEDIGKGYSEIAGSNPFIAPGDIDNPIKNLNPREETDNQTEEMPPEKQLELYGLSLNEAYLHPELIADKLNENIKELNALLERTYFDDKAASHFEMQNALLRGLMRDVISQNPERNDLKDTLREISTEYDIYRSKKPKPKKTI